MTTLDYEVNMAYNRQRVMEIRDSVRSVSRTHGTVRGDRPATWLRLALGGALIAAGQQVCGSAIRCQVSHQTAIGRASS